MCLLLDTGEAKQAESPARRKPCVPQTAASAGFTSVGAGHASHPSASTSSSSLASVFAPEAGPQLFTSMQPPAYALTPNQSHCAYPRHDQYNPQCGIPNPFHLNTAHPTQIPQWDHTLDSQLLSFPNGKSTRHPYI
jgi:hypothetical protein